MDKKSSVIVMMILLITISMTTSFATTNIYLSGTPSSWALTEINKLADYDLLRQDAFKNYQKAITRQEFIYLAVRLYESLNDLEIMVNPSIIFTDTKDIYALKGATVGITSGIGNGAFGPSILLNREQMATMMVKVLELSGIKMTSATTKFSDDASISAFAKSAIYKASKYKIINGYNNMVSPKDIAKTEQVLLIFKNMFDTFSEPTLSDKLNSEQIGALSASVVKIYVYFTDGSSALGSGFIYEPGKIGTNFHVIEGATKIVIEFDNGTLYEGPVKVTGYDRALDLASLSITKTDVAPLVLGNSDLVVKGQNIYTIGSPIGLLNTLSSGLVSSIRTNEIQISAAISHGSSGGVLLDERGQVIGVTYSGIEAGENLGFAIPINLFKSLSKTKNLDLATFVSLTDVKPETPKGLVAKSDGKTTITIGWADMKADYYIVYESVNGGEFFEIIDNEGKNEWLWYSDYCVEITDYTPGVNVVYAVASVVDEVISDYAYSNTVTIPIATGLKTTDEIAVYLEQNFSSHWINGNNLVFEGYMVTLNDDGTYFISGLMDNVTMMVYLNAESKDRNTLALEVRKRALEISKILGVTIDFTYIYAEEFDAYPANFEKNFIYDKAVSYNVATSKWTVFFPAIIYTTTDNYYTTWQGEYLY